MKRSLVIQRFDGGMAGNNKIGPANSFYYARHLDFRKNPTQLTVLPKATKVSGTVVTDLVTDMIQLPSGKIVAIGDAGGIYYRATNGTWTKDATSFTAQAYGMIYNEQFDTVYVPGTTNLNAITNADGKFSGGTLTVTSSAISQNIDQSATNSANTYTTTGSITETATHKLLVTPTVDPLRSIYIWVTTKGTGNLTVTMHDDNNNVLGTSTVANASLDNGALNQFIFSTAVRVNAAPNSSTYHFHITHPSGTASTIGAATASDFSTARYATYANRFITPTNGFHPCVQFLQYICIGNGRYLTVWEPITQTAPSNTEWLRHRLVFPEGYEVTSLALYTEYLAIACEKRSTSAGNEYQDGKIFFWDGTSQTYNFMIDIPEGSPYSLFSHKNILYYFSDGSLYAWSGGNPVKVFQMPNTDTEFSTADSYTVNYPHMMAIRNGILLAGYPSLTSSTTTELGAYSYGARDMNFNNSFGLSYTLSTGTITSTSAGTTKIGCVKSFGDKLFISWKDGASYGIDMVDPTSVPAATATWESLILDDGKPYGEKMAAEIFIDFTTLPTGCTVTPKYKINRGDWVAGTAAVAGDTQIRQNINKRYKEIQLGIDIACTTATPTIYGITLIRDTLESERD